MYQEWFEKYKEIVNEDEMKIVNKMFEELGYKKSFIQLGNIKYKKDDDNVIYFEDRRFLKSGEYDGMHDAITMQELKAINKFCEVMGWLDEK